MKIKNNVAISDSGFIFDSSKGESYSLNPIGTEIMNLMKENKSFEEIKKFILDKYEIDEVSFVRDYEDFTKILSSYSLVE